MEGCFQKCCSLIAGTDVINKQAVLCHRVLRTLQQVTQVSKNIENDTWQTFLLFLLTINDALLAPPTVKGNGFNDLPFSVFQNHFFPSFFVLIHYDSLM